MVVARLEVTRLEGRIGYFRVPSPRLRVLELIHGGLLGDVESKLAKPLIRHLGGLLQHAEVDAIRLHYADVNSPLFTEFAELRGFLARRRPIQPIPHRFRTVATKTTSFAEMISRNERSNQRRREKRLFAEYGGGVRIESFTSGDFLPQIMNDAEYVASRSYQRGLGVGFAANETIRRRLDLYARRGWLRAWILYLGNAPGALWIGALREGTFFSDYLAYDARISHLAPGTYLTMKVLEEMHDKPSGILRVDFGPGDAAYKARFGTETTMVATLDVFARTWRGACADALQTVSGLVASLAKATLGRLGALDRVKRQLRRHMASVPDAS